jgi:hypothetical protein
MLKDDFVPVAIDQWYERRQEDAAGKFYQEIAGQGPRNDFGLTTQGFYIAAPDGRLVSYWNNRGPDAAREKMRAALAHYDTAAVTDVAVESPVLSDKPAMPAGALVVRVNSRVLGGYPAVRSERHRLMQDSIGRDNMWITADEQRRLVLGEFPATLARKIARFHLIDNTRGEPPMWEANELRSLKIQLQGDQSITGTVHLETIDGRRGFRGTIEGAMTKNGNRITGFDLVARGDYWGEGPWTQFAPEGKFPFAVAMQLADGTQVADQVLPQAIKGWREGYLDP